jgi:hypothetical protein
MKVQLCASAYLLCISCVPTRAQEWTEAQVIEKFMQQSPYVREARARIEAVRAEAEGRTLLPNPTAVATREGAGYAAFFQIEQQLPISGRRGLLKQAGVAALGVTETETACCQRIGGRRSFLRHHSHVQRAGSLAWQGFRNNNLDAMLAVQLALLDYRRYHRKCCLTACRRTT